MFISVNLCRYFRNINQIYYLDAQGQLAAEEELSAEESFAVYCKPVEFYNILRRRALRNPTFLQRCLDYKIEAKKKKRIQLTALLGDIDETQALFPLYICLARVAFKDEDAKKYSALYRIGRVFIFQAPSEVDGDTQQKANFLLPDIQRLALTAKSGSLVLLFFTAVENPNFPSGVNVSLCRAVSSIIFLLSVSQFELLSKGVDARRRRMERIKRRSIGKTFTTRDANYCLCGKVSLEKNFQFWDESSNLRLGLQAEAVSTVDLHPCILKYGARDEEQNISVQAPNNFENGFPKSKTTQLQIKMYAQQIGAKEKSSHDTNITALASRMTRLKEGNLKFNFRYYYDKLQRTEVTEDFSCPLCLVRCASYKGIKYHMLASHDLFNYEFLAWEDCPTINISAKTDNWKSERIRPEDEPSERAKDAAPLALRYEIPTGEGISTAIVPFQPDQDCVPPEPATDENALSNPAVLPDAITWKSTIQRYNIDPQILSQLSKRKFYHSRIYQPMELEEVLSEGDSEDEVDDEVADFEEPRRLGNFDNVTNAEKKFMHMWNSFIRKQRVRTNGHVPWACEAFVKVHGYELLECWRLLSIKLWNHGLLDARTINSCSLILQQYEAEISAK
ncbi:hypothetical protein Ahy_A09g042849 [Arachis hypogaea]|uniref:Uncharacterized protein n=1 Tax=Arachis hypogaea TaxID=3818 RepID=A0A445BGX1_ARAHY|nr:hypothetical protein Ahy_A09g042849 [Arachis hypogaea]